MLHVLSALLQQGLLQVSLPFDLEHTFAAAFVLTMLQVIHADAVTESQYEAQANMILDDMAYRGSTPAKFRRSEPDNLKTSIKLWETCSNMAQGTRSHAGGAGGEQPKSAVDSQPENSAYLEPPNIYGLSPDQLRLAADMADVSNMSMGLEADWMDAWLWDGDPSFQNQRA